MKKRKSPDPLAIDLARLLEKRGVHIDFEARLERFRAAEQAAMDPLMEDFLDELFMEDSLGEADALIDDMRERLEYLTQDPREQRKRRAATINREIDARAAELKQCGVSNPITRAKEEAAERWGHDKVEALDRWLRRNRG